MSDSELSEYRKDPRISCKYGAKCYQKNPVHLNKYKHPPENNKRKIKNKEIIIKKKIKIGDEKDGEEQPSGSNTSSEPPKKECISDSETSDFENQRPGSKTDSETPKKECISDSETSDSEKQRPGSNTNGDTPKKECISDSDPSDSEAKVIKPKTQPLDHKQIIKKNFLLDLPKDFYEFWDFCKHLKPEDPCEAFKNVDLKLVGPFDVLAGKFESCDKTPDEVLLHWRYYYDPPGFLTVIKGPDNTGYHMGYFYDSPEEKPGFLASNHGIKDGEFAKMGDNIFAAVFNYLEEKLKSCDPFKKMSIGRVLTSVKNRAEKHSYHLSAHSQQVKDRDKKIVAKTLNKIGLVVSYDRKNQLGYRDLAMGAKELMDLLSKLDTASPEQKPRFLSDLQPVLTYANIALDECDFGTGVKLGWELLFHGISSLNSTILQFLSNSYRLLGQEVFAKIAEAHLKNRKKGCHLSILN